MNNHKIVVRHTSIIIQNYSLGDCRALEQQLSLWDKIYFKEKPYYSYDEDKHELRIPRGINIHMLEYNLGVPVNIDYNHSDYEKISIKPRIMPRDNIQKQSIAFLIGENEFSHTKLHSQLSINLPPGDGKTYCCIMASCILGMRTIVITHIERLKNQWNDSYLDFTNIDKTYIENINSTNKIDKLLSTGSKAKIFLTNHRTLKSCASKYGWEHITKLFEKLKIGLKIYDEAHLEFKNILKIDQYTNVKKTIYATANFNKCRTGEKILFDNCFASVIKYGQETLVDRERHVVYIGYRFSSKPNMADKLYIKNKSGFDRFKYIEYQMKKEQLFNICDYLLYKFCKSDTHKTLVLFSKIDAVESYAKSAKSLLPDKKIITIHSKNKINESYDDADIIISTPQSLGTGVDIDNIGCMIMTEPTSAGNSNSFNQNSGRLRKRKDGKESYYIEVIDIGFETVRNMFLGRLKFAKKKCKKVLLINHNDDNIIN